MVVIRFTNLTIKPPAKLMTHRIRQEVVYHFVNERDLGFVFEHFSNLERYVNYGTHVLRILFHPLGTEKKLNSQRNGDPEIFIFQWYVPL